MSITEFDFVLFIMYDIMKKYQKQTDLNFLVSKCKFEIILTNKIKAYHSLGGDNPIVWDTVAGSHSVPLVQQGGCTEVLGILWEE